MKRNFYLVIQTMRPFTIMESGPLCDLIFADSDVKDHIADKLHTYRNRYSHPTNMMAIFDLYESLDHEHHVMFDKWFNAEMDKVNERTYYTSPYTK